MSTIGKGLSFCCYKMHNHANTAFEKCIELNPDNDLAKMQIHYLKVLRDPKNHGTITEIGQISSINCDDNRSILFIRCQIYIKLKKYKQAKLDLEKLFELDDITFSYILQKYTDFWSHFYTSNDKNLTNLRIINKFNSYMFKGK